MEWVGILKFGSVIDAGKRERKGSGIGFPPSLKLRRTGRGSGIEGEAIGDEGVDDMRGKDFRDDRDDRDGVDVDVVGGVDGIEGLDA